MPFFECAQVAVMNNNTSALQPLPSNKFTVIECAGKLKIRYDNYEEEDVDITKVEPEEGFDAPKEGNIVCCAASGARYSATILSIVHVENDGKLSIGI